MTLIATLTQRSKFFITQHARLQKSPSLVNIEEVLLMYLRGPWQSARVISLLRPWPHCRLHRLIACGDRRPPSCP
jgi:hypothetical protein